MNRTKKTIIVSLILIAILSCVLLACSYVTAKRTVKRLQDSGHLSSKNYVGSRPSLFFSPPHIYKIQPCWVFRFEDIQIEDDHYVSLTGKYLGSRGYQRWNAFDVNTWVSMPPGNAHRGYLDQEQYKKIAIDYLVKSPSINADLTQFDFDNSQPMIPQGLFIPKRFGDIVRLDVEMKRQYWGSETNGYLPTEHLEVLMMKDGQVIRAERQRCWIKGLR